MKSLPSSAARATVVKWFACTIWRFSLSEIQARAIPDLRLQRLTGLERVMYRGRVQRAAMAH
jgi:DNA gyrase/topoisomerase IV subunit A